jgi:ribosome-binding factor A
VSREFERSSRLGERIRRVLADLIRRDLDDRRLALVSITNVAVVRDLAHAKVYYSFLGTEEQRQAVHEALVSAAGRLRSGLAKSLVARTVPALEFVYDDSIAHGAHMERLIASARARDDETHRDDDD